MQQNEKPQINGFPSEFVSPNNKKDKKYGLQYAKAIWNSYSSQNNFWNERKQRDIICRKYAEGLESIEKYKNRLDIGDSSYLNLDFSPTNRIAMIVDNIVGKLMNQEYKIQCNPIDPISKSKEDEDRAELKTDMFLKNSGIADELEKITGISLVNKSKSIPQTDEEAEIYFKLNYKQEVSLAMEEALHAIFYTNDMPEVRERLLRDIICIKKIAIHPYYDQNKKIKIEYVDPIDLIVPYSKYDDFRNVPYQALLKKYTIKEIAQMTSDISEEELFSIAKNQAGKNGNPQWDNMWGMSYEGYYMSNTGFSVRPYDNFNVSVLQFYFITANYEKYREKINDRGNVYFDSVDDNYEPPKNSKYKHNMYGKNIQYRYEGKWVIGTECVFDYGMSTNIEREKDGGEYSTRCELPIKIIWPNIYDMENKSLVERMIPHEDQINLIHLKMQQFLIKAKPPGLAIDVSGLEDAVSAMGSGTMTPIDITKMYEQTGSYSFSSVRADGSYINGKPIDALDNGIGRDYVSLINSYNHELQLINDVIGFNSAVDASSPTPDALGVTQKHAIQATNNVLRPLNMSCIRLIERCANTVSLMIQDSIENNYNNFNKTISKYAVNVIKYGKEVPLRDFGIKIELLPDEEEKAYLDGLIAASLANKEIKTSDAIIVKQIMKQNVKLAAEMLILREQKYKDEKIKESQALQEQNAMVQSESAKAAAQANAEAEIAISNSKAELLKVEYDLKSKLSAQEHSQTLEQIEKKNEGLTDVAEISHESKMNVAAFSNATKTTPIDSTTLGR